MHVLGPGETVEWWNGHTLNLYIAIIIILSLAIQWVSHAWKYIPCGREEGS